MRARTGKIARLPGIIRHELNRRLHNGDLGRELVPWLNSQPEVQKVLTQRFAGRPVTEDNLSAWRRGGFQDWLREEERRVRLIELSAECPEKDPAQRAHRITVHAEERLALELAEELERLSSLPDARERLKCLLRLSHELCRIHRTRTHDRMLRLVEIKAVSRTFRAKSYSSHTESNQNRPFSGLFGPNTMGGGVSQPQTPGTVSTSDNETVKTPSAGSTGK